MLRRHFSQAVMGSLGGLALGHESAWAQVPAFQEGIEYVTLDKRVPTEASKGKIEVIEFFW